MSGRSRSGRARGVSYSLLDKASYPPFVVGVLHVVVMAVAVAYLHRGSGNSAGHFPLHLRRNRAIIRAAEDEGQTSNPRRQSTLVEVHQLVQNLREALRIAAAGCRWKRLRRQLGENFGRRAIFLLED